MRLAPHYKLQLIETIWVYREVCVSDLTNAVAALSAKGKNYRTLWRYYDGDHPMVFANSRLRQVFGPGLENFVQNWCGVVVSAAMERMSLERFVVSQDDAQTQRLNEMWLASEMDVDVEDVHESLLVTGEAFVFVWKRNDGTIEAYHNDAQLCEVFYESANPRRKRYAVKWWYEEALDGWRLNLYYRDRIEYYFRQGKEISNDGRGFEAFAVDGVGVAENPFGEIPIFHFRKSRRKSRSELQDLIPIQDGVNKLFSDMMVAAEYGAFPQRYIISNADIAKLKNAPNEIWDLPGSDGEGQDTQVGQLQAAQLQNFWQTIEKLVESAASVSRTPHYYFFKTGTSDLGGEALIALEGALVKKVQRYVRRLQNEWQKLAAFMLALDGQDVGDVERIRAIYGQAETLQPYTQAQVRQLNVGSGIPLITQLRNDGWSESEIEQVFNDLKRMKQAEEETLVESLEGAMRRFDQGGGV